MERDFRLALLEQTFYDMSVAEHPEWTDPERVTYVREEVATYTEEDVAIFYEEVSREVFLQ
ncbi:MAG: hypothetical protein QM736_16585 [Vicinamibacterales bacterium]